ncbi:hypothetical protein FRC03_003613 [Tulasnella sp. 419]|nr:hypothetical protein FRC03_003613 [Tulasnella sp. 419]
MSDTLKSALSQRPRLQLQNDAMLFETFKLNSLWGFIAAALLTASICLSERFFTFFMGNRFHVSAHSPKTVALRKTSLYALVTTLRLSYMLISMSLHVGLIAIIVISLSIGQFYIEYKEASVSDVHSSGVTGSLSSKISPYSPIPNQAEVSPRRRYHRKLSTDDVELAITPSTSRSDVAISWTKPSYRSSRDQARKIMQGTSSNSTLRNHQRNGSSSSARGAGFNRGVYIHARQSSNPQNGLTHSNSARKALFHIGSADDEKSTDTD